MKIYIVIAGEFKYEYNYCVTTSMHEAVDIALEMFQKQLKEYDSNRCFNRIEVWQRGYLLKNIWDSYLKEDSTKEEMYELIAKS